MDKFNDEKYEKAMRMVIASLIMEEDYPLNKNNFEKISPNVKKLIPQEGGTKNVRKNP